MKPNKLELEQVGNALLTLNEVDYTAEQLTYINPILKQYALDVNDLEMAKIFNHQSQIMDAIRALHDFSFQFQNEEDVYDEFKSELDYLYDSINGLKEIGRASV